MVRKWSVAGLQEFRVGERLTLIEALTESLPKNDHYSPLTEEQKEKLVVQLNAMDPAPKASSTWDDIVTRILRHRKLGFPESQPMSIDERIELIGDIWDSIDNDSLPPLTKDQEKELERRLAAHLEEPSSSLTWEQVKEDVVKRLKNMR